MNRHRISLRKDEPTPDFPYWLNMSAEQRATLETHVRENDYPIALRQWNLLASAGGFCPARTVLKTPDRLYQLVAHSIAN